MSINKIFFNSHLTRFFAVVFFVATSFFIGRTALADIPGFVSDIIGWIALRLVELFGIIFVWFVDILIDIVQFNEFTTLSMVETGWGLVRDLANMFFIVVLLIIAFATVLKISSYHYQKTLAKLLIMAILINFSKLIAGFLIDFFQVIMLTFVNGFKDAAAGNLAAGFGIYEMLAKANTGQVGDIGSNTSAALAALLAVLMIIVADMVVLIMIAVMLWRIAMLWILVILSPLAYLSYAFIPKYWSQWWQMFFQHLTSGPIIAFFLWVAMLTMQQDALKDKLVVDGDRDTTQSLTFVGSAVNNKVLMNYFVSIALFMGGLAIAQKVAAQSGGAVGSFAQKVQKIGAGVAMYATGGMIVKRGFDKVKKFQQMRQDIKDERDARHAAALMGVYGSLKQKTIGLVGQGFRRGYTKLEKTQERDQNLKDLEAGRNELLQMEDKGWNNSNHENYQKYQDKKAEVTRLEKERTRLQMRKWAVRGGLTALAIGSLPVSSLVGAGTLAGVAGTGIAAALAGSKKMSQSGQAEKEMAKNWRMREVGKHSDEMKKMTDNKLEVIIRDEAENHYRRLAALFEKIVRGNGKADEEKYYSDLVKRLGGGDKVINDQYNNLIKQYLPGAIPKERETEEQRTVARDDFIERTRKKLFNYDSMDIDSWKVALGSILRGLFDPKNGAFDHTELTNAIKKASPAKKDAILEGLETIAKTDQDDEQRERAIEVLLSNGGAHRVNWSDQKITNEKFAQMYQKNKRDIEGSMVDNPNSVSLDFIEKIIASLKNSDVVAFYNSIKKSGRSDKKTVETYLHEQAVQRVNDNIGKPDEDKSITSMSNILKLSGDVEQVFKVNPKVQNKILNQYSSLLNSNDFYKIKPTSLTDDQLNRLTEALMLNVDYATVEGGINKGIQEGRTKEMGILAEKIIDIASASNKSISSKAQTNAINIINKASQNKNSRLALYL